MGIVRSYVEEKVCETGQFAFLAMQVLYCSVSCLPRYRLLLQQMVRIGARSLPVVLITGAFTGMVLAVQTHSQFARVQMENLLGAVVGVSMVREIGPVLTGLVLAGRVGASMTAELGAMKVSEQIDALRALGTDPVRYLIVPRFISCVTLIPLLVVYGDVVGIWGGWLVSTRVLSVDPHYYWEFASHYVETWDIVSGMIKASVFGGLLCLICCFKGFTTSGGAEGVGRATTEANVATSIGIIISNFFMALMLRTIYNSIWGS